MREENFSLRKDKVISIVIDNYNRNNYSFLLGYDVISPFDGELLA
jgi:hypothetical protein